MKNITYTRKFYVHEIAAVDLSKIYFLKNAKKTSKPNNRDLTRDSNSHLHVWLDNFQIVRNYGNLIKRKIGEAL